MTTLEEKIKQMLSQSEKKLTEATLGTDEAAASSAGIAKATLPVGIPEPGDQVAVPAGGSQAPVIDVLDDDAPGKDAALKVAQVPPIAMVSDALGVIVPGMSEDVAQLFAGQELTEDFKAKASSLFEAAVTARSNHVLAAQKKSLNEEAEARISEMKVTLAEQVDSYLTFATEAWAKENAVGITHGLRSEITESFMTGLKGLYEESMLNVSDESLDVVTALTEANDSLKTMQNETVEKLLEAKSESAKQVAKLNEQIESLQKEQIIESVSKGLTAIDCEKLKTLIEGVEFSSKELFTEKVSLIKKTHFSKQKDSSSSILEESQQTKKPASAISAYVQALQNTSR